jgi:hypothetical protein
MSRRLASVVVAAGMLAGAEPAFAAGETRVTQSSTAVTVRSVDTEDFDFPGIENRIAVQEAADGSLRIREATAGVAVTAEAPCFLVGTQEVSCPGDAVARPQLVILTGKGPDTISVDLPAAPARVGEILAAGGPGLDVIVGSAGPDTLFGDAGKGVPTPGPTEPDPPPDGGDAIWGRGGADLIRGEGAADYLNGGFPDLTLDPAGNVLEGGEGRDFLDAGRTPGPDRFVGGTGADVPLAGSLPLLDGAALVNGGQASTPGGDTVSYQTRTYADPGSAGVNADLDGTADDGAAGENDEIEADVEALVGTLRDDTLTGAAGDNRLTGGLGVDRLAGGTGADSFLLKDGIRDRCYSKGTGDTVDADLTDPHPDECPPFGITVVMPPLFTFNAQPVDETIPYVVIGARLRRTGGRLIARVRCPRSARRPCRGRIELARARRNAPVMARSRYRVRRGRTGRVALRPSRRELVRLRADRRGRLTAVARGTSKLGPTSTSVVRRVR